MIGRLRGTIIEKQPPLVIIEAGGIGYEVHMPMTCFYALPDTGLDVAIFSHFVVREDAQLLFGFNSRQEQMLFRALIKVNGVGPRLALAILSGMSADQFISAVQRHEIAALVKLPGVGKKTAERLVIEMSDRLQAVQSQLTALPTNVAQVPELQAQSAETEAAAALVALGYKPQEASRMISGVVGPGLTSETLIREALRAAI